MFTAVQKDKFVSAMGRCKFKAGANIVTQGDRGDYFYVIESGACDVLVERRRGEGEATVTRRQQSS